MRLLIVAILLGACGGDPTGPVPLRAEGTATATEPGTEDRVECTWFLDIPAPTEMVGGWTAEGAVGEVFRRSFRGDQPLFEFQALVGGPVSLVHDADFVEARLFGDQPADAMPFWSRLEVISGVERGAYTYEGDWICAPILPGDPDTEDLELDAPGTWTIAPAP